MTFSLNKIITLIEYLLILFLKIITIVLCKVLEKLIEHINYNDIYNIN
jgi:hypothetical protein